MDHCGNHSSGDTMKRLITLYIKLKSRGMEATAEAKLTQIRGKLNARYRESMETEATIGEQTRDDGTATTTAASNHR